MTAKNPFCHKNSPSVIKLIGPCSCDDCVLTPDSIITGDMEYLDEDGQWYEFAETGGAFRDYCRWKFGQLLVRYRQQPERVCVIEKEDK